MKTSSRNYSTMDKLCLGLDQALRTLTANTVISKRAYPALNLAEVDLTPTERQQAARLMRVNHAGEVAAQALYQGQAIVSRDPHVQLHMQHAAEEENDHLVWCNQRLIELGSHTSYLNPLWYTGSLVIGIAAGLVGDKWSLGFVAETESQVVSHLEKHLDSLPSNDIKSQKILTQMQNDENQHRELAIQSGAAILPSPIKKLMQLASRIMVKTAFWI